jgi:hypothetical protein
MYATLLNWLCDLQINCIQYCCSCVLSRFYKINCHDGYVLVCWFDGVLDVASTMAVCCGDECANIEKPCNRIGWVAIWFSYNRCSYDTHVFFGLEMYCKSVEEGVLIDCSIATHVGKHHPCILQNYKDERSGRAREMKGYHCSFVTATPSLAVSGSKPLNCACLSHFPSQ